MPRNFAFEARSAESDKTLRHANAPIMILSSPFNVTPPHEPIHTTILKRCLQFYEEDPDRKALIPSEDEQNSISFKQVYDYSMALSSWFISKGYKKGDIVLLYMVNCWQYIPCCLGAWSAGLVVSPASSSFTEYELRYQLEDTEAKIIITQQHLLAKAKAASQNLTNTRIICISPANKVGVDDLMEIFNAPLSTTLTTVPIDLERDLLVLPYSSGTTGTPKGVMVTHMNYAVMLQAYIKKFKEDYRSLGMDDYVPSRYFLAVLPFCHSMGLFGMLFHLYGGTALIIMSKFDMRRWLQHIQDYKLQSVMVVPALALQMANTPLLDNYDLSSVLMIASGSAPLSDTVVNRIRERLPDVIIRQGYGMTELSIASHIASMKAPSSSVGELLPSTRMKIISEDGKLCGPYDRGEIWISGPQVMRGYWKRPEETKAMFDSEGFLRTGDIGYYDDNGMTYICDRKKELIKVSGKQVSPSEIEALLLTLPEIADCCVFGVPDEKHGEVPVAYVVSKTINEKQIHAFVNERLASYKRLQGGIRFVDEIPRTATGKILRRQLRDDHLKNLKLQHRSRI